MSGRSAGSLRRYLGYVAADHDTAFAEWFDPVMAPLPTHVVTALDHGPQAAPTLLVLTEAPSLLDDGDHQTENGYGMMSDGSMHVAVRTAMPGVTPAMWDWWFGWHGNDARRYKLWHPRAHLKAAWADGDDAGRVGRARYVGRTSIVDEYIGSTLFRGAIQFVAPSAYGLDEARLADPSVATAVCARIGAGDQPVDAGHLIHHVRSTPTGSEMRSRFWLGGPHVAKRGGAPKPVDRVVRALGGRMVGASPSSARDLMVHCAQEMNHLAARLPALFERFGDE